MAEDSFQEKTEPATDKRREDARRKGKVPRSMELTSAFVLLFGLLILSFSGGALMSHLAEFSRSIFVRCGSLAITRDSSQSLMAESFTAIAMAVGPLLIGIMIVGLAANITQVGFNYAPEALRPKFEKVNPLNGIRRIMLSRRSLVELAKSMVKIIIVGSVAYATLNEMLVEAPQVIDADPGGILAFVGSAATSLGLRTGLAFLVLAALDFFYQRFEFERDLRMSKEEVKEETKTMEGDPLVKSRIRSTQRRIAYRRMMQDVPRADVVVTNPTHLAVAIRYDVTKMTAPTVVAKGADYVALKIREIALQNEVPIVEDKPLAQALYRTVDIGEEIPEKLFQAVAQLLAYIYRMKQGTSTYAMN